jgi:hypothetical protein
MKLLRGSLVSILALAGALLINGCSQEGNSSQNAKSEGKQRQDQSSPTPRSRGGQVSAGAIQNVRQAAQRVPNENELHNFALAYTQYALLNGQGPSNVQEVRDSLTATMAKAFEPDGIYAVNWRIKNPSSSSILAYVKAPDVYGTRLVARGDATVVRMSKDEFERAIKGR